MEKDKTDDANLAKEQCYGSLPDKAIKEQQWQKIIDPNGKQTYYVTRAWMAGFYQRGQMELIRPYFKQFLEVLPKLAETRDRDYVNDFVTYMTPFYEIDQ